MINILTLFLALTYVGLPLALLSSNNAVIKNGIFFAPLFGMIFYSFVNLFLLVFIELPNNPLIFLLCYFPFFCVLTYFRRRQLLTLAVGLKSNYVFFVLPLIVAAILFSTLSEIKFFPMGEDELQYVSNAVHMLTIQNRGLPLDSISPRLDHWIVDHTTMSLVYNNAYRRGAELILALIISITKLNPYICFSIACLSGYLIYLSTIPAIFKESFQLSKISALIFQSVMAVLSIWILLSFQGSLGNLLSLGMVALSILAYPIFTAKRNLNNAVIYGFIISGPIIYYSEAALILCIVPVLLSIGLLPSPDKDFSNKRFISWILISISIFSNINIYGLILNNFIQIISVFNPVYVPKLEITTGQIAGSLAPIYGLFSYFSNSQINAFWVNFTNSYPNSLLLILFIFLILAIQGAVTFTKRGAIPLAFSLVILSATFVLALISKNFLILIRSGQYSVQLVVFGITLLLIGGQNFLLRTAAGIFLVFFACINLNSSLQVALHIKKYNYQTDPLLIRYHPNQKNWHEFSSDIKEMLDEENGVLLISGYNSTPKTHLIMSIIEPSGSIIDSKLQAKWGAYDFPPPLFKNEWNLIKFFQARNFMEEDSIKKQRMSKFSEVLRSTEVAVIPQFENDPSDWPYENNLIGRKRIRYEKIGEVVKLNTWSNIDIINSKDEFEISHTQGFLTKILQIKTRDCEKNSKVVILVNTPNAINDYIDQNDKSVEVSSNNSLTISNPCSKGSQESLVQFKSPITIKKIYSVILKQ